jgi:uncharacterized DUF497 family protein
MEWEWDDAKDAANTEKHGISFAEALQVFTDSDGIEKEDLAHSSRTEHPKGYTPRLQYDRFSFFRYAKDAERREYEKAKKEKGD